MADLQHWIETDRKVALRLLDLMNECLRAPMEGKGKPEALKRNWSGWWSRRLTEEDRIVYRASDEFVELRRQDSTTTIDNDPGHCSFLAPPPQGT
jgi:toxin YoeB